MTSRTSSLHSVDEAAVKAALARFASGVVIATTIEPTADEWVGFTASAFTGLSMDPPLVLVCLNLDANCHAAFTATQHFAINVLAPEHVDLAMRFASRGADKFADDAFRPGKNGMPVLDGALGVLECDVDETVPGGDHTIIVGRVTSASSRDGLPAVYFDREFRDLSAAN